MTIAHLIQALIVFRRNCLTPNLADMQIYALSYREFREHVSRMSLRLSWKHAGFIGRRTQQLLT